MKYRDLVHFDPIETIKVLREADDVDKAKVDVQTFVISERMLEQLQDIIVPHLRFDAPGDNKAILTVANYGTGKTHLMSVISGVAEHGDLVDLLTNEDARDALTPIAGKFRVIRSEIGATTMSLRDIVCSEIEKGLAGLGVTYSFPDLSQVTNTKDSLVDTMVEFEKVHPDRALLFVLDELLDYLRGRKDAELIQDLAFLREVGEICRSTRFRFIGGVQEAIFDNPRFANVADAVRRVKDRFEQIRISREDVAFVVKERLLKKTTEQRDKIREHLQQFTPLYEGMAERLEDFVELFPVHPSYLRTFEQIAAVEKREVLKTLSSEMKQRLDDDVPEASAGLMCYDSYRARLSEDPSTRAIPDVREVLEKSEVLRNKVQVAMPTKQYMTSAVRVIDALAVHRLTTDDIHVPIGVTKKELRDDLCLLPGNLPEKEAFFLETTVDAILDEIMRAVSGQFITENPENGQFYLDVRKDIDYDQRIAERTASLDDDRLDEAYFHALEEVLELRDAPYVAGYRIWEYELKWESHNVGRIGYLFMGAPNERSTAQPPRDFYIYFLQPYDPPRFKDEEKTDEVFFRLDGPDDDFTDALKQYAGATALSKETTAQHRGIYEEKARAALQAMVSWLRQNMGEAVTVTYRGDKKPLRDWLSTSAGPRARVKDQIDSIAAAALDAHFDERYPDFPVFEVGVTKENVQETVRVVLNHIAVGRKIDLSKKILRSLKLMDNAEGLTADGPFAQELSKKLKGADGKALNRSDLLTERDPGVWSWEPWYLDPVWLVVTAAVLTQLGRAEIGFPSQKIDALALERLSRMSFDELKGFKFISPPKELPVIQLRAVVKLMGLPEGFVSDQGVDEKAIPQIMEAAQKLLTRVVEAEGKLQEGVDLWGAQVIEQASERAAQMKPLRKLLEEVKARNSVGKMARLAVSQEDLESADKGLRQLEWVEAASSASARLAEPIGYLREAVEVFGDAHPLSQEATIYRGDVLAMFRGEAAPDAANVASNRTKGEDLRKRFAEEAVRAHTRNRLDGEGDARKRAVLEGATYRDLGKLAAVSILPVGRFGSLQTELASIQSCLSFDEGKLLKSVVCPQCKYRPSAAAGATARASVDAIGDELEALRKEWAGAIIDSLREPEMKEQIDLLGDLAVSIQTFLEERILPSPVDDDFVKLLNQVFGRFEVRRVSQRELWEALFPEQTASTVGDLQDRFDGFLADLKKGVSEEKLRVLPAEEEEE